MKRFARGIPSAETLFRIETGKVYPVRDDRNVCASGATGNLLGRQMRNGAERKFAPRVDQGLQENDEPVVDLPVNGGRPTANRGATKPQVFSNMPEELLKDDVDHN